MIDRKCERLNELSLFAGGGGGLLGSIAAGFKTVCAVEIDADCRDKLFQRQRDGHLAQFPIWDDIGSFDGFEWRGCVDVVSGGFPCQDISAAGKGRGITGASSGLVFEMLRVIAEIRPKYVIAENSPNLRTRGLGTIVSELTSMGYDSRWGVLGAWHAGAYHRRNRMWIVALANTYKQELREQPGRRGRSNRQGKDESEYDGVNGHVANAKSSRLKENVQCRTEKAKSSTRCDSTEPRQWLVEPSVGRVVDGMAHRVDRLRAIGNGQVPAVFKMAWDILGGM